MLNIGISCQMQHFLSTSLIGSHIIGILMTFVFLSLEGGMSFDRRVDEQHPTDWSRANMVSTFFMSIVIYSALVMSSKMQLGPNVAFLGLLMALYTISTHRQFLKDRKQLDPRTDAWLDGLLKIIIISLIGVAVYGVSDYIQYQHQEHPDDFSWKRFFIGKRVCDSVPL